jgi:hypothetical protein
MLVARRAEMLVEMSFQRKDEMKGVKMVGMKVVETVEMLDH